MQRDPGGRWLPLIALLLFCAGILSDPPWRRYSADQRVLIQGEAQHVAANLMRTGEFASPFGTMPTGPTAHVAPGFPYIESWLFRIFGLGSVGWLAMRALPTIALSLQYALLPYAARSLGFGAWVGVLASFFGLILKPAREDLWEAHLAGLVGLVVVVATCRWIEKGRRTGDAALLGSLAGAAILLQPVFALPYFACVFVDWYRRRAWDRSILLVIVLPGLICLPWVIRNERVLGYWGLRDNLGLELSVSFNDCAPYGVRASEQLNCFQRLHPDRYPAVAERIRNLGEAAFNRERFWTAVAWMSAHPGRTASLIAQRFWFFWFPSDKGWDGYAEQRKRQIAFDGMTIVSVAGLILSLKRRVPFAWIPALWLALFPAIYYVVQYEIRYRFPVLWLTWLEAAYVAVLAIEAARSGRKIESA